MMETTSVLVLVCLGFSPQVRADVFCRHGLPERLKLLDLQPDPMCMGQRQTKTLVMLLDGWLVSSWLARSGFMS